MSKQYEGLDRYLGRFSGTFDVEHDDVVALDPDGVVVAVVVCKRIGANEKNDQRTGEDTVTYVLRPVEFSVIRDEALARALRPHGIETPRVATPRAEQLTLPFPESSAQAAERDVKDPDGLDDAEDDLITYEKDDEVFVPPVRELPRPSVGGALKNDPVLARFVGEQR